MAKVSELMSNNIEWMKKNQQTWSIFYNMKEEGAKGDGVKDDKATLDKIITKLNGKDGVVIFPKGDYRIASNLTIPKNVYLYFVGEGYLVPDSGVTITINGGILAGPYQIFKGEGNANGSNVIVDQFYTEWWGAKGDGITDDTVAITKTVDMASNSTILFFNKTYLVTNPALLNPLNSTVYKAEGTLSRFLYNSQYYPIPLGTALFSNGDNKVTVSIGGNVKTIELTGADLLAMRDDVATFDARLDTLIQGGSPDKDLELIDIRTPDINYIPFGTISVAGDLTRDIQKHLVTLWKDNESRAINVKAPLGTTLTPAKGNGTTDDTAALQAIINYAMDKGVNVFFPTGKYLISDTLLIDNSTSGHFSDPRKISLIGSGVGQTTIHHVGGGAALKLIGGKSGELNSFFTYQQIKDIRFLGNYIATGTTGVEIDTCSFMHLSNVEIQGFQYGFDAQDMDNSSFTKCIFHYNSYGIRMRERSPRNPLTSTRPNNINFYDCQIGGNINWGGLFVGGSCINFFGGDVQGNGDGGTDATKWGVQILNAGVQGGVACNFYGTFFESNVGVADLWLFTQGTPDYGPNPCVYNVHGCTFNHSSDLYENLYNILAGFDSAAFGQQKLVVTSCGFKNFNDTYTPTGRKHVYFAIDPRDSKNFSFRDNVQSNDNEKVDEDGYMPASTNVAGAIGEYKQIQSAVGAALSLPAGGKWEWAGYYVLNSTGEMFHVGGNLAGVDSGGTQILPGVASHLAIATIRRIS